MSFQNNLDKQNENQDFKNLIPQNQQNQANYQPYIVPNNINQPQLNQNQVYYQNQNGIIYGQNNDMAIPFNNEPFLDNLNQIQPAPQNRCNLRRCICYTFLVIISIALGIFLCFGLLYLALRNADFGSDDENYF